MKNEKLLTKIIHGSHLYGCATQNSDNDFKSVYLPSGKDVLLGKSLNVKDNSSKKELNIKNTKDDIDDSSYSLAKFLKLIVDGDTTGVEILLAPKEFRLNTSEEFEEILSYKDKLLNRKSRGFVGYARTQAVKYSNKGSRLKSAKAVVKFLQELHNGPQKLTSMASKIGYYENKIEEFVKDNEHCSIEILKNPNGTEIKHLVVCGKMLPFTNSIVSGINMYKPMEEEYGIRAREVANDKGIDFKAFSHAIRVCDEAIELLSTGNLTFPRSNAEYLLNIKLGRIPYIEMSKYLESGLEDVERAASNSILPETSDLQLVEDLIVKFHRNQII